MFLAGPFLHLLCREGNKSKILWPQHFREMLEVPAPAFSARVYELPVAAVTKDLVAESNTHSFSYSFGGSRSEMGRAGLLPEALRETARVDLCRLLDTPAFLVWWYHVLLRL